MCLQVVERYAACRCIYYTHGIDKCSNTAGHRPTIKEVLVGYSCLDHADKTTQRTLWEDLNAESEWLSNASTLVAGNDAIEEILFALASDDVLKYLWPQIFSSLHYDTATAESEVCILLRKWGQEVRKAAQEQSRKIEGKLGLLIQKQSRLFARELRQQTQKNNVEQKEDIRISFQTSTNDLDKEVESEPEDIDESIVDQFDDVRDFCLNGEAFLHLKRNVETYVAHITTPDDTWLFDRVIVSLKNFWDMLHAEERPFSAERLAWTCPCGRRIVDDYIVNKPGAMVEFSRNLSNAADARAQRAKVSLSGSAKAFASTCVNFFGKSSKPILPESNPNLGNKQTECSTSTVAGAFHNFLLLCIPFMRTASKSANADICQLRSDRDFFALLKNHYDNKRGRILSKISLRKVSALHFVQFEMYRDDFVDIRANPSLPPETNSTDYAYDPMPPDMIPPIGSNLLLHFYEHPTHASVLPTLLAKIPKKLKAPLVPCPVKGSSVGWGIQIHEGFHWFMFFGYCVAAFLGCMVVGGVWAGVKGDVQGGFGVAGFLMTGVAILGGLVHTRAMM